DPGKSQGSRTRSCRRTNTWSEIAIQPEAISVEPWVAPDLVGSAAAKQGGRQPFAGRKKAQRSLRAKPRGTGAVPAQARIRARKSGPCRGANAAGTVSHGEHGRYSLR